MVKIHRQLRLLCLNCIFTMQLTKSVQQGKEAIVSFAEGDEQRMMLMGLKRFTKYANQPNVVALRTKIADKIAAENGYFIS